MIEREAKSRFERAGREFMQATAALARLLRPHAKWGYYGFPYCFNMAGAKPAETCSSLIQKENDQISWLWSESTALYPSVYSSKNLSSAQLAALIRGRVAESARVGRGVPILPYFWFKYRDAGFMSEVDLKTALKAMYKSHTSGFILWGSSNDVNTVTKCEKLKTYLDHVLGPEIAKYTKETYTRDEPYNINNVTNQNNITTLNPLYFLSEHSKDDENQKVDSENEEMDISSSEITQSEIVDDKVPISTNNDLKTTDENNILLDILISLLGNIQHNYDNKTTELTLKKIAKDRKKGTPIHDTFTQISDNKNDFTTSSPLNGLKKKGTIFSILGALYPPKNTTVFDDTASTIDESMYYDYNHTTVEITSTTKDSLITERNYKSTTVDILYDDNNFTMYYNQDTFPDEELNYTTVTENLTETTSTVSYDKDGSKAIILFDYQFSDPKNNEQNSINTEVGDNTEKNRPPIVFDTPIKATTSTEYLDQESTADFNGSTHEGVMSTTDTMTPEDHTYKDTVADDYENEDVQVPGSSQVDRKYFICLYFYFYLMSKCFCDMCGQC